MEDSADARSICDKLGIPFYVWDFSEQFKEEVIGYFSDEVFYNLDELNEAIACRLADIKAHAPC